MVFLLFITVQQVTCSESDTFHIVPSSDSPCPGRLTGEPCFTLRQYASGEYRQYVSGTSSITLEFQPGRHFLSSDTILASNLDSFMIVSVNLTEIACSTFRSDRIIEINSVQNIHISGIRFSGCRCQIESATMVIFEESSFQQVRGYALRIRKSSSMIKMCTFSNGRNTAIQIENGEDKTVFITNSNFTGNTDNQYNAAGALLATVIGSLEVFNSTFVGNVGSRGGALAIQASENLVTIHNCSFINNEASIEGGAVFTSSSISVYQSTFIGNSDRFSNSRSSFFGGAMFVSGGNSSISIHQSMFTNNTIRYSSRGFGGAIYITGDSSSIYTDQSMFITNRVRGFSSRNGCGGAIYITGDNSSVTVNQSTFIKNEVLSENGDGGAIYVSGDSSSVSTYQSALTNNTAATGDGGAVFMSGDNSYLVTEQSSLTNNNASSGRGGAVYTNGRNSSVFITETTFSYNTASRCGALSVDNFQHHSVRFNRTIFTYNAANSNNARGGVMCIRNASISVLDSTFSHNTAAGNAGVFAVDDSHFNIRRVSFENNTAQANGGVIATEFVRTILSISQTSFTNNQASEDGGVMYMGRKGSQVKISKSGIGSNSATRGGVIAILGSSLEITETDIFNSTADAGEAISACSSDVTVSEQLLASMDPVYPVCMLFDGDVNDTSSMSEASTTNTPTTDATIGLPTEPIITSVYFELNGKVYPNNSIISLLEVGEDDSALLCKTDLTDCCGTPPNRLGEFYYPSGDIVPVRKVEQGFYRNRGVQEVRLNRREGVVSPAGKFRCEVPDASGTVQTLHTFLVRDE